MNSAIQIILVSFSGIIGSIIGLLISGFAEEELEENKKMLIYIKSSILIAMTFLLFFNKSIVLSIIVSLAVLTSIFFFEKKEIMKKIILYLPIIIVSIALIIEAFFFEAIIGLVGLFFIMHMGIASSKERKTIKKGVWKKEAWKLLVKENYTAFILPILFSIIVIIL